MNHRLAACALTLAAVACGTKPPEEPPAKQLGTAGTPGAACTKDGDCTGAKARCLRTLAGGYCVNDGCTPGAKDSCPAGSFCIRYDKDTTVCAAGPCKADNECARASEGYRCDFDHSCWSYDYVAVNAGKAAIGGACVTNGDCESGECVAETVKGAKTGFTGGYCTHECSSVATTPCPAGATCSGRQCLATCQGSGRSTCREGYVCDGGACTRDLGRLPIGDACASDNTCGFGTCLSEKLTTGTMPGGYCTLADQCDPDADTGCGSNGHCVASSTQRLINFCAKKCGSDTDCRAAEGYACVNGRCLVPRAADPAKVKLGKACTQHAECNDAGGTGGFCIRKWFNGDQEYSVAGGYCAAPGCTSANPDLEETDTCGAAGICIDLGPGPYRMCLARCSAAAQCRTGEGHVCDEDQSCWYYPPG